MKSLFRSFLPAGACLFGLFALIGPAGLFEATSRAQTTTDELVLTQLTSAISSIGVTVRGASYDGKRIVFESINDYTGENADLNNEIFVYDIDLRRVIQITKTENLKDPADETKITLNVRNNTPVISGDGRSIVFTSNARLTDAANDEGNQEIYLAFMPRDSTTPSFTRITDTGNNADGEEIKEIFTNYQPVVNADGTRIAFVSTRRAFRALENGTGPFTVSLEGANRDLQPDANGEIFVYDVTAKVYRQVTISRDEEATVGFTVRGFNSSPQLSGNGQRLVFVSAFNYPGANANKNADFNGEIHLYEVGDAANTFRQLTETTGTAAVPFNQPVNVLASFTRAFDFSGNKLVFESAGDLTGSNADKTRELYLADLSGAQPSYRQVTNQATAELATSDFAFLPSLNGAGTMITFNSTINLVPAATSSTTTDNGDRSKEIFSYDIAASTPSAPKFRQLTFTPVADFLIDQRTNATFSFGNDIGDRFIFNYFAVQLAPNLNFVPEIFEQRILPVTMTNMQEAKTANAASFDATQVARNSIAAIFGTQLANTTASAPTPDLPFEIEGVHVTVKGLAAQIQFVSPGQINFIVPQGVGDGDAVDFTINNNGLLSSGKAKIVTAAPGLFTLTSDGAGTAAAQCGAIIDLEVEEGEEPKQEFVFSNPPCSVGTEARANFLILYGTGWRNVGGSSTVTLGEDVLTPVFSGAQGFFIGLDQINLTLPLSAMGKGELDVKVTSSGVESKVVKVTIQ